MKTSHGPYLGPIEPATVELEQLSASAFKVLENEPAHVSGSNGFRVLLAYTTLGGLEMQQEVFGVTDRDSYYQLSYAAPKLYYFPKDEPEFAESVRSFKLAGTK